MKIQTDLNGYILNVNTDSCNIEYNGEYPQDLFENARFYKLIDNTLVYDEQKRIAEENKEALKNEKTELLAKLKDYDYIGAKIAEGRATIEEYADKITQKTAWADRINEIDNILSGV